MEEDDAGETAVIRAAVRSAKKAIRPSKIGLPEPRVDRKSKSKDREKKRKPAPAGAKVTGKGGIFDRDMGEKRRAGGGPSTGGREGARARKGDAIGGMGKKGGKGGAKGATKGRKKGRG